MRANLVLLILIPILSGCNHRAEHAKKDTSTFAKRMECAKLANADEWEDLISGPFLDHTYYSASLDTCIFVMKGTHRGEKDGSIHSDAIVVDALTRKQLWANEDGDTEAQVAAKLNQELQTLQITP